MQSWFVWREGWRQWQPVEEVPGLTESLSRQIDFSNQMPPRPGRVAAVPRRPQAAKPKPPIHSKEDLADLIELDRVDKVDHQPKSVVDNLPDVDEFSNEIDISHDIDKSFIPRTFKRYRKKMKIEILGRGRRFETTSVDISVGGVLVRDALPDWVAGYFKVRMSKLTGGKPVELTCYIIENQEPEQRRRLAILPLRSKTDEQRLEHWFSAA